MEESVGKMYLRIIIFFFLLIIRTSIATTTTKPNIVFVLADDFGHANIGYHRRDENGVRIFFIGFRTHISSII